MSPFSWGPFVPSFFHSHAHFYGDCTADRRGVLLVFQSTNEEEKRLASSYFFVSNVSFYFFFLLYLLPFFPFLFLAFLLIQRLLLLLVLVAWHGVRGAWTRFWLGAERVHGSYHVARRRFLHAYLPYASIPLELFITCDCVFL